MTTKSKATKSKATKTNQEPEVRAPEAVEKEDEIPVVEESVEKTVAEEVEKKTAPVEKSDVFQYVETAKPGDVLVVSMSMRLPASSLANAATKLRAEAKRAGVSVVLLPYGADNVKVEQKDKGK